MDRAGKKARPLSRDELEAIFQAVHEGEEWQEARKRLSNRDRVTVRKAYNVIQQFEVQRPTRLDDTASGLMAEAARYGTTASWVRRVFIHWRDWARTGTEDQEFGPRPKERAHSSRDDLQVEVGPLSHSRRPGTIREYSSAWVIDITLTNSSQEFPVGIKRFVLETIRSGKEAEEVHILHHIGKDVQGSHGYVPLFGLRI